MNMNFKINNFDLIRLLAALQVAMNHSMEIMGVELGGFWRDIIKLTYLFPGVPIFFFISGYLISRSFENNHNLFEYALNRILRLFPALIACVTLSYVFIYTSGYMQVANASLSDWLLLYLGKVTFLQFYNPDFMRAYGDGVLNGSLWTISVEIQFYVILPIVFLLIIKFAKNKVNLLLGILILVFLVINLLFKSVPTPEYNQLYYKLFSVSFMPWFFMFLAGVFFQKNFELFYKYLANRFVVIFPIYCITAYYLAFTLGFELGNKINPILFLLLAVTIFSCAYSMQGLSEKLLKRNDISYGVYIYHMPVVNILIYFGHKGNILYSSIVMLLTVVLAIASWKVIEKPCLALKRHALNPVK